MKTPKVTVVPDREKTPGNVRAHLLSLLFTVLLGLVYFYFTLPAINLQDTKFYTFFLLLSAAYCLLLLLFKQQLKLQQMTNYVEMLKSLRKHCLPPLIVCGALAVVFIVGWLLSSAIFRARDYAKLLTVTSGDFTSEVQELSFDKIPMLDKSSAQRLGDRKLGELSDMVSQFEVSADYPQMNYNGRPVRVATLLYGDFFKWWNNFRSGLPAYILTDMGTQNVEVVRLPNPIRYSQGDKFFRNIDRYLRINYPTFMFDAPHMEIDDDGNPFWICPRIVKRIGLFGGTDIDGMVMVNAVTGGCTFYETEEIPVWVDQVFSEAIIVQQYDYYGTYGNGFLNSLLGQKNVTVTTEGNNFIAQNDDVYVYTGITSVGDDQSIIGFILANQRTKQTSFYPVAGAKEYSASVSAEGVVQHLSYVSTFPLLLNISGEPTYFMSLKDNADLVKMYAMVNVQQYNIVATGVTVAECRASYIQLLSSHGIAEEGSGAGMESVTAAIEDIKTAVIDGNSYYYLKLAGETAYFAVSAADSAAAVILEVGDRVTLEYDPSLISGDICPASLV